MALPQPLVGLISTIIGIAIPFVVLYFSLAKYDSRFKDKQLFFTLVFSLVLGTIITLFHISITNTGLILAWFLPAVLGLAMLEFIIREVFLRLKRFRGDRGIPFYGLMLGLGMGAMIIFGRIYTILLAGNPTAMEVAGLGFFALAVVFVHGGLGMEAGRRPRDDLTSIMWQLVVGSAFNLGLGFFYIALLAPRILPELDMNVDATVIALMAMIFVLGVMYFRIVRRTAIVQVIPEDDGEWADYPGGGPDTDRAGKKKGDGAMVDVSVRKKGPGGKKRRGEAPAKRGASEPRRQARRTRRADRGQPRTRKTPGARRKKRPRGGGKDKSPVPATGKATPDHKRGEPKARRPVKGRKEDADLVEVGGEGDVEYLVIDGGGGGKGDRGRGVK